MEFLRRTIERIRAQLGTLTASQKLVIGLCIVIMVGAVFWMVRYVGQREMVPLLNQTFAEGVRGRIVGRLDMWDQAYEVKQERIWVPKSDQMKLLARLGAEQMLPKDTSVGWSYLLEGTDIWTPESERANQKVIVLQMTLAQAIQEGWPEIDKAEVFINAGGKRGVSQMTPPASASVIISLLPGSGVTGSMARGIANVVAGANHRMKAEHVKVVINGQLAAIPPEGQAIPSDMLALKAKMEEDYRQKIFAILPVANALVAVDVTLEDAETETTETRYSEEGDGSWNPTVEERTEEDISSQAQEQQEPGFVANGSEPTQPGASTGQQQERTSGETSKSPFPGKTTTVAHRGKGGMKEITGTVRIPISYFEAMAKGQSEEEPTAEATAQVKTTELSKIRKSVMVALGLEDTAQNEGKVFVDSYWAGGGLATAGVLGGGGGEAGSGRSMAGAVTRYGKHIAVSALALMSLFMVLMMVRKSTGPIEMEEEEASLMLGKRPADALGFEEINIADGEDGGGLLSGLELDPDAVRSQQVLEQVREMVEESPENAAKMVNKWIGQG